MLLSPSLSMPCGRGSALHSAIRFASLTSLPAGLLACLHTCSVYPPSAVRTAGSLPAAQTQTSPPLCSYYSHALTLLPQPSLPVLSPAADDHLPHDPDYALAPILQSRARSIPLSSALHVPLPPHTHPPAPCLPMTLIALRTEHPPTKGQSLVQSTGESRICQTSLMITSVSSAPQPHVLLRVMPRGTQRAGRCVM